MSENGLTNNTARKAILEAYRDKKIVVVGLGKTGLALAKFFRSREARVTVSDADCAENLEENLAAVKELGCAVEVGGHTPETFLKADLIVLSPGVPENLDILGQARERGIPVVGELEIAAPLVSAPIIAVTGTNGKTTTTELICAIMKREGKKFFKGGNIGTPLIEFVMSKERVEYVVLEVSSFQLDTAPSFHPQISVLLNITEDHLDRYSSLEEYRKSKVSIFKNQTQSDFAIINADDPLLPKDFGITAHTLLFSKENAKAHAFLDKKQEVIICKGDFYKDGEGKVGEKGAVFNFRNTKLVGVHNLENMLAASLVAFCCGIGRKAIQETINNFPGLPHRLQFVREWNKVRFYNDSKGTNVGAVVKALESFSGPVVLLAGGRDKGGSYDPLVPLIKEKVRALILFGESRRHIAEYLGDLTNTWLVENLDEAVRVATTICKPGDVVLLSPACASFDQYKNYQERGLHFEALVRSL